MAGQLDSLLKNVAKQVVADLGASLDKKDYGVQSYATL